jgi:L-ascorbate metabolism protein UlaG (beta-lactamase superfamily)
MTVQNENKRNARRRFLALGCVGTAAGLWFYYSNQYVPRILRELIADSGRAILQPAHTPTPGLWDDNAITAAWLGHSTVLLNFYGLTILTDPVLFRRVGADLGIGTVGPKRLVAPALTLRQLPDIDLVLLSHAHMDHFDLATLRRIPGSTKAVTASKTADLFAETRIRKPVELAWGESTTVRTRNGDVAVRAFEVAHWGARWRRDTYRGYNGYTLEREGKKIIFGGDTAMCDSFRSLRSRKPYDLAIMPIGAYQPWVRSHCTPEQAVHMANQAGARTILPIHHRTFKLGQEGPHEPIERFQVALQNERQRIALREIGETACVA